MNIQYKKTNFGGEFFIEEADARIAEIVFRFQEQRIVIEHTEVSPALRKKNIGAALVNKCVELARKMNLQINATCPYAKSVMKKHS